MSPTTRARTRRELRRPMCRRSSARKGSRRPSRRMAACPTCRLTGTAMRDPERADIAAILRQNEQGSRRRNLYFPQVLRDARRIGEYYPGLSPDSPECMDRLGVSLAHLESQCSNIYDAAEVERVFYPEIEKLLLDFFQDATDALV